MKPLLWIILTILILIILIAFIDYSRRRIVQSVEENATTPTCPECPSCPECPECPDVTCPAPAKCPDVTCPDVNPPDIHIKNEIPPLPPMSAPAITQSENISHSTTLEIPEEDLTLFDATPDHVLKYKAISSKDILVQKLYNLVSTITHQDANQDEFNKHTLGSESVLKKFYQYYHRPEVYYSHEKDFTQNYMQIGTNKPSSMFVPPQKNSQDEIVYYETRNGLHQRLSKPQKSINDDMRPKKDAKRAKLLKICRNATNYQIRYYKDIDITAYQNKTHNASYHDKVILNRYKATPPYLIVHIKGVDAPFIYQDKWYWVIEKIPL